MTKLSAVACVLASLSILSAIPPQTAFAQTPTKTIQPGEQAPPADPGQRNFGAPVGGGARAGGARRGGAPASMPAGGMGMGMPRGAAPTSMPARGAGMGMGMPRGGAQRPNPPPSTPSP